MVKNWLHAGGRPDERPKDCTDTLSALYVREACKSAHDSFYLCVLSNKGHYYQGDIWTQYNPVNEIKFYDIFEVKNSIPLIEM